MKGVGYVERMKGDGRKLSQLIEGMLGMSEREVCEMFAEGVLRGRGDGRENAALYVRLKRLDSVENPVFLGKPGFWHYLERKRTLSAPTDSRSVTVSLQSLLSGEQSEEGVRGIITGRSLSLELPLLVPFVTKFSHRGFHPDTSSQAPNSTRKHPFNRSHPHRVRN